MRNFLIYYSVVFLGKIIRRLPLQWALCLGAFMGYMVYLFDIKRSARVYYHLKVAFVDTKSLDELRIMTKEMYKSYGQNFIDILRLPLINKDNVSNLVEVEGLEYIENEIKRGKGVMLLVSHSGSWELGNIASSMLGFPYTTFANRQDKHKKLGALLNNYRSFYGDVILNQGLAVRGVVKALKKKGIVAMVVDQGGKKGTLISFFGKSASMNGGVIRIARCCDSSIIMSMIHRKKDGTHKLYFFRPAYVSFSEDEGRDVQEVLSRIVKRMEEEIRKYPTEYMWIYKIWKYSKEARICILSDGKIGHKRQSESVASNLQKVLKKERDVDSTIEIISPKFKNCLMAKVLSFLSVFWLPYFMRGRLGVLKYFLEKESLDKLLKMCPEYIISCGSSMASLNYILSKDHLAKSIAILKPGLLSFDSFDLIALPNHDKPFYVKGDDKRFAITFGAPNLIAKSYLSLKTEELCQIFPQLKIKEKLTIGVLIGGEAKDVYLSTKSIGVVIEQLKAIIYKLQANVLVSTSRRTSKEIDKQFQEAFLSSRNCPLLVCPNEKDIDSALGGIIGLSDLLLVSGDSLSMISESASSGKPTIVFFPDSRQGDRSKHHKFIKKMSNKGFILACDTCCVGKYVYDFLDNKRETRMLDDNQIIYNKLCGVV